MLKSLTFIQLIFTSFLFLFSCGDTAFWKNETIEKDEKSISIGLIFPADSYLKYNQLNEESICKDGNFQHSVGLINEDNSETLVIDKFSFLFDSQAGCIVSWKVMLKLEKNYRIYLKIQENMAYLEGSLNIQMTKETNAVTLTLKEFKTDEKVLPTDPLPTPPVIDPIDGGEMQSVNINVATEDAPILKNSGCSFDKYYYNVDNHTYNTKFNCFIEFESNLPVIYIETRMFANSDGQLFYNINYDVTQNPFTISPIISSIEGFYGPEDDYQLSFMIIEQGGGTLVHEIYF